MTVVNMTFINSGQVFMITGTSTVNCKGLSMRKKGKLSSTDIKWAAVVILLDLFMTACAISLIFI